MPLTISPVPTNAPIQAFLIPQKLAATTTGSAVGTSNMFNCTGVIIHNPQGNCGVVAHVEAQTDDLDYLESMFEAFQLMMSKLNSIGGGNGPLDVVLMGNGGGSALYAEMLLDKLPKWTGLAAAPRLVPNAIIDMRNTQHRMLGTGAVPGNAGGRLMAFVYNPAAGSLAVDMGLNISGGSPKPADVTTFAIQFD
jgi:hypothetical protein